MSFPITRLILSIGLLLMSACNADAASSLVPPGVPGAPGGPSKDAGTGQRDASTSGDVASGRSEDATVRTSDAAATMDGSSPAPQVCRDVVDVVFVLDVTSSMGFVLDELQADIDQVVRAANDVAPDAHFGLIAFADNHALDTSGPLDGGRVHIEASTLQSALAEIRATYTDADRNPGDGPRGPARQNPVCEENALDALYGAAEEFPWRDNATRVVIVATDETFLEAPDNYGDRDADGDTTDRSFPREGNYPARRTVPETVAALQQARIRVFSFTRKGDGPLASILCSCKTNCRFGNATHLGDGWSAPYKGHPPIPQATDGANFDLQRVQHGELSLAETIHDVVVDSYCNVPVI